MKPTRVLGLLPLIFCCLMVSAPFHSCEPDDEERGCDSCRVVVYKPNIYIYPNEPIALTVKLGFPLGGEIVASVPEYGTGWNIQVDTSGLINNTYSYLFYESTQPDVWQGKYGWEIETGKLEAFFRQNLTDYGFKGKEIDDFIAYWIPRLNDYPMYLIYPQIKNIIDQVIQLNFSKQPENMLRLFYVIKGQNHLSGKLTTPAIDEFKREGYFASEWGVILK